MGDPRRGADPRGPGRVGSVRRVAMHGGPALSPQDRPEASGKTMARRQEPWTPEGARTRLLGVVLTEAARAGRAKWAELAQVIRTLADRFDQPVDKAVDK